MASFIVDEECDKNVNEEKSDAWGEERLFFISTDIIGEKNLTTRSNWHFKTFEDLLGDLDIMQET